MKINERYQDVSGNLVDDLVITRLNLRTSICTDWMVGMATYDQNILVLCRKFFTY